MCASATPKPVNKRSLAKRTNVPVQDPPPPKTPPLFHVVLFSHSQPNTSAKASFNFSQDFDDLTWDALPDEFKHRRIQLHIVLLTPSPALSLLHKRASFLPTTTFPASSGHTVLVSGIALKQPPPAQNTASARPSGTR